MARLRAHGCEFAQGYRFWRPLPEEEPSELITPLASTAEQLLRLIGRV
jgi:EAL domain-containing protein (putative c-di-GMP-specific phosphodiesterase class I)